MKQLFLDIFKKHLLKEETILWSGRPNVSGLFSRKDTILGICFIIGSLIPILNRIIFARVFKIEENIRDDQGWIIGVLMGILFAALGFYQIIGKPIRRKYKKEKTFYAITNKRLLILEVGTNEKVISKYISKINTVDIFTSSYGTGTIKFGENSPDGEFSDINDAQNVYELINNLRSKLN